LQTLQDLTITLADRPGTLAKATEAILEGSSPTKETADRAAETLAAEIHPIDDVRSTADYRRAVSSRVVHRPRPQDDPRQRRPDISRANDLLEWAPRIPLKEGLMRTIAYFEELLKDETISPFIVHEQGAGS